MDVRIVKTGADEEQRVEIHCREVTQQVREIADFVRSRQGLLTGMLDGRQYGISVVSVYYAEAVDERVFLYSAGKVYETKHRLYELEERLKEKGFLRVSKSMLLNLMKVKAIKPMLNGRFLALLDNGEEVVISRKYVPQLKNTLKGGDS